VKRATEKGRGISRRGFLSASLAAVSAAGLRARSAAAGQDAAQGAAPAKPALKIKDYRTLGRTGFKVSDISFGAGDLSNDNVLRAALEAGVNYIDTAEH